MLPYIMSKYAAVAFTEALRQELSIWGIRVIAIEPESFKWVLGCRKIITTKLIKNDGKV